MGYFDGVWFHFWQTPTDYESDGPCCPWRAYKMFQSAEDDTLFPLNSYTYLESDTLIVNKLNIAIIS